ncbi:hypothetical protein ACX1DW_15770 [Stutzerimonas sp. KH-1]
MQTTQHAPTPCQVLMHPASNLARIFEVRRLARDAGCQYVTSEQRRAQRSNSFGPQGGDAA